MFVIQTVVILNQAIQAAQTPKTEAPPLSQEKDFVPISVKKVMTIAILIHGEYSVIGPASGSTTSSSLMNAD